MLDSGRVICLFQSWCYMNAKVNATQDWVEVRLDKKSDRAVMKTEIKRIDGRVSSLDSTLSGNCTAVNQLGDSVNSAKVEISTATKLANENSQMLQRIMRDSTRIAFGLVFFLVSTGFASVYFVSSLVHQQETQASSLKALDDRVKEGRVLSEKLLDGMAHRAAREAVRNGKCTSFVD